MKTTYKLTAIIVFTISFHLALGQRGVWKRINDIGVNQINSLTPKSGAAVFTLNGKAYVGTGFCGNTIVSTDFWEYDPMADTWTQKAPFAGGRRYCAVAFSIGGKGYVATGMDSINEGHTNDYSDLWEYDPASDTWTQKASLPAMNRVHAIGFTIGNYGYLGLGITDSGLVLHKDFWRYDPVADSWTQMADYGGAPRENAVAFALLGKGYVTTGDSLSGRCLKDNDVWEYDPVSNSWTQKANFPGTPRCYAVATAADSFAIVGTGQNDTGVYLKDQWKYSPLADSWTEIPNAGTHARVRANAFTLNNMPYLAMGDDSSFNIHESAEVWQYNSAANTWVQKANSGIGTITNALGFSIGNNGYLYGGGTLYGYPYQQFLQYNPTTGSWNVMPRCPMDSLPAAVTFSTMGNGYAFLQELSDDTGRLWQYNPNSNIWVQKAPYNLSGLGLPPLIYNFGDQIWLPGNDYAPLAVYNVVTDSWSSTQYFYGWTTGGCSFTINDTVYQGCGIVPGVGTGTCVGNFTLVDTNHISSNNAPSIPGREYEVCFVINGKAYVGLGDDCNYDVLADMYEYNPAKGTFTRVADFPGVARKFATAFSIGGNGYVGGGEYFGYCYKDFWTFNPNSCFADTQQLCIVTTDTVLQSPIVIWEKANKYATDSFYIYRANTPDTAYTLVATINRDTLSQWEDTSAHCDQRSYRYKLAVKDTCGFINDLSAYHQTMYLTSAGPGQFAWTPYAIENSTVPQGTYYLYRDTAGNGNWQVLQVLADTQTHATDTAYAQYPHARYMLVIELSNPCNPTRGYINITSNILSGVNANTGLADLEETKVKVFPNPAHNQVTVSAPGLKEICITDVLGQVIYQGVANKDIITLPTNQWITGVYFYQIKTNLSLLSGKLVKD